ncbi:hypothetical protein MIZ03_1031 [Rhodoferax lithotrophicus]|uniref:Uncharacterized protein n=1 Tax=Rhodoferax lithotrophicus TaxID=2798804 RepID=A0ABM7MIT6_9BURK|nr:hypothetical protein MIZ03_1031 [Rhodoferax sp. MIZ03]
MHNGNADTWMLRFPLRKSKKSLSNNKLWQMFRRSYFACAGVFVNWVAKPLFSVFFSEQLPKPITNVRVWIQDVPKENWRITGVSAKELVR